MSSDGIDEGDGNGKGRSCILFFVKFPEPGRVKTRLTPPLTPREAADLYRCMVLDHLDTLDALDIPAMVCFTPATSRERFIDWLGEDRTYLPQEGGDLGERMRNAFQEAWGKGYRRAVLIGSDIPHLPVESLREAMNVLDSNGVTIGPTHDGGYYLIGFRRETFLPEVFEGIRWSSGTEYRETVTCLLEHDLSISTLAELADIDDIYDLKLLLDQSNALPSPNLRTTEWLGSRMRSRNNFL